MWNIFSTPAEREMKAQQREAAAERSWARADRHAARGNRAASNRAVVRGIEQANQASRARSSWADRDIFDF